VGSHSDHWHGDQSPQDVQIDSDNHLKHKANLNILKFGLCLKENTTLHYYNDQLFRVNEIYPQKNIKRINMLCGQNV
jgi:hypothetical protein